MMKCVWLFVVSAVRALLVVPPRRRGLVRLHAEDPAALLEAARRLREEAAELEREVAAEKAREVDDLFELAARGRDRVDAAGLAAALETRLVFDNYNSRDAEKMLRLLPFVDAMLDGESLTRDDFVSAAVFRTRLERISRAEKLKLKEAPEPPKPTAGVGARAIAFGCFFLPALDAASFLRIAVCKAALLAAVCVCNFGLPRIVRFAARHALLLDLVAVAVRRLGLGPPLVAFEAIILVAALSAAAGRDSKFVPVTGTLTSLLMDDAAATDALRGTLGRRRGGGPGGGNNKNKNENENKNNNKNKNKPPQKHQT